jgi:hypothetical protein
MTKTYKNIKKHKQANPLQLRFLGKKKPDVCPAKVPRTGIEPVNHP